MMAETRNLVPETRVLAIASHVVYGYVGNKVATFVMQALGIDVSSINTVNYSNHTGYKQVKGTKTSADEILDLYQGLQSAHLSEFDMMLSGYLPSAEAIDAVGKIGRALRFGSSTKPGSFFWVLDPVLGDNGKLYVPATEIAAYRAIMRDCDLILPNQFELETLTEITITDSTSLIEAVGKLHSEYRIPHVFVTSTQLGAAESGSMSLIGSSATADGRARMFKIEVTHLPVYFTGTGDMFAALLVARLREQVEIAGVSETKGWRSADEVTSTDLPLAKAAEKVVGSMQAVLTKTYEGYLKNQSVIEEQTRKVGTDGEEDDEEIAKIKHMQSMKAIELKVIRNVQDLVHPPGLDQIRAQAFD